MSVYFIRAGKNGPVKIGTATNPKRRLSALQIGHHEKLALIRVIDGNAFDERELHEKFKHQHIRGEWFRFCPTMLTIELDFPKHEFQRRPSLHTKLREWLNNNGLTESDFAARVGKTQASINRYCCGVRIPRGKTMRAIVVATGGQIQPNDFFQATAAQ